MPSLRPPEPPPSGIGRPLDPSLASNRLALGGTALAATVGLAIGARRGPLVAARSLAVATSAVFGAWAIARELDPDEPRSAAVAMPLAVLATGLGAPSPSITIATLLWTRTLAGTVGVSPTPVDRFVLGAVGTAGAIALASRTARRRTRLGAGGTLTLGAGLAGAAAMVPGRPPTARTDVGARPLAAGRVRAARLLVLGVLSSTALARRAGVAAASPVAAAAAAPLVVELARRARWTRARR